MKLFITLTLLAFSISAFSQSKAEVSKLLDKMKKNGTFSAEQVEAAKKQLNEISAEDMNKIIKASKKSLSDPKVQEKLKSIQGL